MLQRAFKLTLLFTGLILACFSCEEDSVTGPADDGLPRIETLNTFGFARSELNQGDSVIALGRHLDEATRLELLDDNGNQEIPFSYDGVNSFRISFVVPQFEEGVLASYGDKILRVTSPAGSSEVPFFLVPPAPDGPIVTEVFITNFDGRGPAAAQGDRWFCYGDSGDSGVKEVDAFEGKYYQIAWEGATDNGFIGCSSDIFPALAVSETNAEEVTITFMARGNVGGILEVIFQEGADNNPFTARYTFESADWQEVSIPLSDFGVGFSPDDQSRDIDPARIVKVQFGIAEWSGVNPTIANVDNVRLVYEE